ncbi:TPA: CaiF/GrlA family transcriptional regulator [Serratia liquefaciens]|nr:CaiF/GrlA family transcriptional regulator [Serratia liquefaciens]
MLSLFFECHSGLGNSVVEDNNVAQIINETRGDVDPEKSAGVTGNTVSGKQSNHGDFYLPACLTHLIDPPLYMAVAWWGLLTGQGMTREDISQAFRIPPRRAADVMAYISRERCDVITCERRIVRAIGRRSLMLRVSAVRELAPVVPSPSPRVKKMPGGGADPVREWRRWFLSRPNVSSTE